MGTLDIKKINYQNLESLTEVELKSLQAEIDRELQRRESKNSGLYKFEMDCEADKRKAHPYAAKLYLDENGKLQREFLELNRDYNGVMARVYGEVYVREDDIIELQTGGSWKNKYRIMSNPQ